MGKRTLGASIQRIPVLLTAKNLIRLLRLKNTVCCWMRPGRASGWHLTNSICCSPATYAGATARHIWTKAILPLPVLLKGKIGSNNIILRPGMCMVKCNVMVVVVVPYCRF